MVGILVMVSGGLVNRYDNSKVDVVFWSGILLLVVLLAVIVLLILKISKRTKEIGEL